MIQILISSPTLRANKDYELQIHACKQDSKDEKPFKRKEIVINSHSNQE